ncbi:MAG: sugar phosphate isomerase/epimerase [Clostridia bacterium]|nr:sugar phosphate isomerase/epimerase [Clostridia bacterium]
MKKIFKRKFGFSIGQMFDGPLPILTENGFNYLEVGLRLIASNREFLKNAIDFVLEEQKKLGFEIKTAHLPIIADYDLSNLNEEKRLEAIEKQKEAIEFSKHLGYSIVVLHPDSGKIPEEDYEKRHNALIKSLKDFAPWCRERGIKIALENLTQVSSVQTSKELLKIIEAVGEDNLGICFDVNHLFKETHREFIKNAGKYILTMHTTDNDGELEKHWFPGDGVINWRELFELLDEINYDSTMICECANILSKPNYPDELVRLKDNILALNG